MSDDLAEIRGRGYRNGATGAECARLSDAAAVDVPRLLAAVEAALKLADRACGVHWGGGRNLDPAKVREAITAALTGGEAGDG